MSDNHMEAKTEKLPPQAEPLMGRLCRLNCEYLDGDCKPYICEEFGELGRCNLDGHEPARLADCINKYGMDGLEKDRSDEEPIIMGARNSDKKGLVKSVHEAACVSAGDGTRIGVARFSYDVDKMIIDVGLRVEFRDQSGFQQALQQAALDHARLITSDVLLEGAAADARNRKRLEFARMQILGYVDDRGGKVAEMFDELIDGIVGED